MVQALLWVLILQIRPTQQADCPDRVWKLHQGQQPCHSIQEQATPSQARKGQLYSLVSNIAAAVCLSFARANLKLMTLMPYCICSPEARILETCSNGVMLCLGTGLG